MHYLKNELLVLVVLVVIALISFFGMIFEINKKFSVETPAFGGTLTEGIVGNPRFINPILSQTDVDRNVVSLVYTGLMRYDQSGKLRPALLENYEISPDGVEYTIKLKKGLEWSNGKKLTADDIVFTIQLAKNPIVQSPRRANWEGIEVSKVDDGTVRFRLQKPYYPFLDNLTLGILPKYLWEKVPPSQISFSKLNIQPIGAGPYKIESIEHDALGSIISMELSANGNFSLGKPNIKKIILKFYQNEEETVKNLKNGVIDSFGGLSPKFVKDVVGKKQILSIDLQRIIGIFFNHGKHKTLSAKEVRDALDMAIDKQKLVKEVLGNYGKIIGGPLPPNIAGDNVNNNFDAETAKSIIDKKAKGLSLTITTAETPELLEIANFVKKMWENIGVNTEIQSFALTDLEQLVIGPRRYDAFLYGEEVVGQNPDPFAFWHSSQRTHPGYNIALYANSKVDSMLESIQTTQEEEKRTEIYKKIQKEIYKDTPAVFLFSPSYIYAVPKDLKGVNIKTISTGSERFSTIHEWYLKKQYVWKIFSR